MKTPLILIPQHFGSLTFDRRDSRYQVYGATETALLKNLICGPWGELARTLSPARRAAGQRLVEELSQAGKLDFRGRLRARLIDREPPQNRLLGPLVAHVELNASCNLSCRHCFAGELPRRVSPLNTAELDRLFAELASLGCFRLGLTGGEPLLRPELLEIVDSALAQGLHPCLTTNGLLLNEAWLEAFAARPALWLNLSLDGATAASNDHVRGQGTFAALTERLRSYAGRLRFTLAMTIMAHNYQEAPAALALATELQAHSAIFRPLYPTGEALKHPELMPSFAQYQFAMESLRRLRGNDSEVLDPLGSGLDDRQRVWLSSPKSCGAGDLIASISVDGQVNPCSFLGSRFDAGSLRERSFEELWSAGASFVELREAAAAPATDAGFQGGCRARAQAINGSAHALDPWEVEARGQARLSSLENWTVERFLV